MGDPEKAPAPAVASKPEPTRITAGVGEVVVEPGALKAVLDGCLVAINTEIEAARKTHATLAGAPEPKNDGGAQSKRVHRAIRAHCHALEAQGGVVRALQGLGHHLDAKEKTT